MSQYRPYVQLFARRLAWDLGKLKSDLFNIESLDILCTLGESVTICTPRRFNTLIHMVEMWLYWNVDNVMLVIYMPFYLIACICQGSSCINIAVSITFCYGPNTHALCKSWARMTLKASSYLVLHKLVYSFKFGNREPCYVGYQAYSPPILKAYIAKYMVNALNSWSVLNTGNGPQSSLSLCNWANSREAAYQCVMGPKAAKRPIIV